MENNLMSSPTPLHQNTLRLLYLVMVVSDLTISWFRSMAHFNGGVLVFHILETTLKLTTLLFVLRTRRWAYGLQLILSLLAFVSSIKLLGQANQRAVHDPLLWISLGTQVIAGICCAFWLFKSRE